MLQPGTQVGRYEIQRRLGRGGMGTVYVAHDPVLGRMVAIKLFSSDLDVADASERFTREARSAAALNHTNIVTVHDFGDFSSQPYIVMEYVQGETLGEIIRRKPSIALSEKLRWIEELCSGVAYAHQFGVIHRDIKPPNLMIDRAGRLKVLDFGIARMLGPLTSDATALIGTPGYMAPEQILGGSIDHRSDIFSVGVVCYELLSYSEAFPGDTIPTITHRILSEDPVSLTRLVPEVSSELAAIVERALKKSASERFPDAFALGTAIKNIRRNLGPDAGDVTLLGRSSASLLRQDVRPGTSSDGRPQSTVAPLPQTTPQPNAHRPDVARRRTAQIEAALERAREYRRRGDLASALDACEQALTFDDAHPAALEIEQEIRAAAIKSAETLVKAVADAEQALASGAVEVALVFAREALALDPDSEKARTIEVEATRRLNEGSVAGFSSPSDSELPPTMLARPSVVRPTGRNADEIDVASAPTMIAPSAHQVPLPSPIPTAPSAGTQVRAGLSTTLSTYLTTTWAALGARPRRDKVIAGWAGVVMLLAAIGIAALRLAPRPAPPVGALIIDAIPWAMITSVETEDGTAQPLPSPASTPLALNLAAGTYRLRLTGPPPDSESRMVTVRVEDGKVATVTPVAFKPLTPEDYFEQVLDDAS